MNIVVTKLDPNMTGPMESGILSEADLIARGYVFVFYVFNAAGQNVRVGVSQLATEAEVRAYVASGMTRLEWEARNAD